MKPILILKTGSTYPEIADRFGDFDTMMIRAMTVDPADTVVVDVTRGLPLPAPVSVSGAVITGSHAMVTDGHGWIDTAAVWIQSAVASAIPLLGICFGHQILAHAMGGRVGDNRGRERMGSVDISLTAAGKTDPLLSRLPDLFPAHVSHDQSVLELPPAAILLATGENEPHHAFRIGANAWGLQFHPEFTPDIMRSYLEIRRESFTGKGWDVGQIEDSLRETPRARKIMAAFAALIKADEQP
ncbi:MAG: glutamine amidotransferase [Desulfobacteraceae bacterium]|nr:glutamine amidotransferase [Desulfobacteraceae bacterium]